MIFKHNFSFSYKMREKSLNKNNQKSIFSTFQPDKGQNEQVFIKSVVMKLTYYRLTPYEP